MLRERKTRKQTRNSHAHAFLLTCLFSSLPITSQQFHPLLAVTQRISFKAPLDYFVRTNLGLNSHTSSGRVSEIEHLFPHARKKKNTIENKPAQVNIRLSKFTHPQSILLTGKTSVISNQIKPFCIKLFNKRKRNILTPFVNVFNVVAKILFTLIFLSTSYHNSSNSQKVCL